MGTTFLMFEVIPVLSFASDSILTCPIHFNLLLSNWLRVYWPRPSQENIILYIQLFIFIMFFIQNIYDNKQSTALLGLFVLNCRYLKVQYIDCSVQKYLVSEPN